MKLEIIKEIDNISKTIGLLKDVTIQLAKERLSLPKGRSAFKAATLLNWHYNIISTTIPVMMYCQN